MVGRKKKAKICGRGSQEDRISKLPESLICDILYHLPTKDAVRTSVLSTRWRSLWQCVPGLNLHSSQFSNFDAFVSFVDRFFDIPQSMYACKTLVRLRLYGLDALINAEFVSLPCLKIMRLEEIGCPKSTIVEKLISGSPVLEDLTIRHIRFRNDNNEVLQVRSQTLTRIDIIVPTQVVIDAPLLQSLSAIYKTKKYKIIGSGFPARLDIDVFHSGDLNSDSVMSDIITDMSRVRDLVIRYYIWQNVVSNMGRKIIEPKVTFSTVPRCLVSSLKFVEWKRSSRAYEGEMELVKYILENSTILEKLRLDVYYTEKAKCVFLTELNAMQRCSSVCQVIVSVITKENY